MWGDVQMLSGKLHFFLTLSLSLPKGGCSNCGGVLEGGGCLRVVIMEKKIA